MKKAKKSLSQNFLIDKNICKKIINQVNIKEKIVIEIGPGKGFLSEFILSENPRMLYLIEKDDHLSNELELKYINNQKVKIFNTDVLKINFKQFKNCIVISNLPYNISTKIILYLFTFNKNIDQILVMIQKEVALKFDYNLEKMNKYKFITSLICNYKRCFNVSPLVFKPRPKVNSTVVKFILNKNLINFTKVEYFNKIMFKNLRKKIKSKVNLKNFNNEKIINKRIDSLSIKELVNIYDFF